MLITDHNVREALEIIDRGYILHEGRVLKEGTPAEIVGDRDVRRVYLGERFSLVDGLNTWRGRTKTRNPAGPIPGDDAAIAAGDQAAAIVQSSNWPNIAKRNWKRIRCWSATTAPPTEAERERVEPGTAAERADDSLAREDFSKVSDMDQARA